MDLAGPSVVVIYSGLGWPALYTNRFGDGFTAHSPNPQRPLMPALMELPEIIAALNAYVGTDKAKAKEVAKSLRTDARDVAQHLINVGAGQKAGEVGGKVDELQGKVNELTEQLEAKDQEITDLRTKAPDATQITESERKKWEPKVIKERERADTAEKRARELVKSVGKRKFIAALTAPDEQGMRVDAQWAEKVVAAEYDDRFVPKDDYTLSVLQPGEQAEYDADTEDAKITALARDARRSVPATYIVSNADSGAGVRSGGGGGVGLKTVEQIKREKQHSPAFAGI